MPNDVPNTKQTLSFICFMHLVGDHGTPFAQNSTQRLRALFRYDCKIAGRYVPPVPSYDPLCSINLVCVTFVPILCSTADGEMCCLGSTKPCPMGIGGLGLGAWGLGLGAGL